MTKEEYLKGLILQRWTLKDFAAKINMPYGTLYSILKNVDGGFDVQYSKNLQWSAHFH